MYNYLPSLANITILSTSESKAEIVRLTLLLVLLKKLIVKVQRFLLNQLIIYQSRLKNQRLCMN